MTDRQTSVISANPKKLNSAGVGIGVSFRVVVGIGIVVGDGVVVKVGEYGMGMGIVGEMTQ